MSISEIAAVKAAIEQEYTAAKLGLEGLAYGTAQHTFITARTERLADLQRQLVGLTGQNETEAMRIFLQTIEATPETPTRIHIRQELERLQSERTAHLLDWLIETWETYDYLQEHLGAEAAQMIVCAPKD
jgi:hypothetical protein